MSGSLWLSCEQSEARPSPQATFSPEGAAGILWIWIWRMNGQRPSFRIGAPRRVDCTGSVQAERFCPGLEMTHEFWDACPYFQYPLRDSGSRRVKVFVTEETTLEVFSASPPPTRVVLCLLVLLHGFPSDSLPLTLWVSSLGGGAMNTQTLT